MPDGQMTYSTYDEIDLLPGRVETLETAVNTTIPATYESLTEAAKQTAALAQLIDTVGHKNLSSVNSGSNTLPTRWMQISIALQPGTYILYAGNIASTDTDATTCQFACFDASNNVASNYVYVERGSEKSAELTVTAETSYCRLYSSDSYAHSENDTVTVSDFMICSEAFWDISQKYVPYQ